MRIFQFGGSSRRTRDRGSPFQQMPGTKKLFFAFLILLFFLLALEGGVRLLGVAPEARRRFIEFYNDPCDIRRTSKIFRFDEHTFWEPVPGEYRNLWMGKGFRINSHGFRGEEISLKKPEGTYRILGVGDSCTLGIGVTLDQTFLKQLQALLARTFPQRRFEVVNGGVPGYSSYQGRKRLEQKLVQFQPDLATIYFAYNDLLPARKYSDREATAWAESLSGKAVLLAEHIALYRMVSHAISPRRGIGELINERFDEAKKIIREKGRFSEEYKARVPGEDFKENVAAMVDLLRRRGCRPMVLGYVFSKAFQRLLPVCREYMNAAVEVAEEKGVESLALGEIFETAGGTLLFEEGVHPNPKGHALIAQKIFEILKATGL